MQMSQMVVQAMWITDSPLLQLPYFTKEKAQKFKEEGVEDVTDFINMDDEPRLRLLGLPSASVQEIADACNHFPSFVVKHAFTAAILAGKPTVLQVVLEREGEENPPAFVHAPYFPKEKEEFWWLVLGDPKVNKLAAIKRVSVGRTLKVDLKFTAPDPGTYEYALYFVCDSYIGFDQKETVLMTVGNVDAMEAE
eukprot:TRINITY_DN1937_c0_g1_i1.p1 TRINITY_DN1937_c0_g1~~TRINITY_DN1937_c0_g1_i1.p1  ORF type:complete len:194 (+),score=66.60 TRINITY_DN1937_c0_g1_i1:51-632(+)